MVRYTLTDLQRDIVIKNIHHYYTPGSDPHNELALALNVPRHEAKRILYTFLWTQDAHLPSLWRKDSFATMNLVRQLSTDGRKRSEIYEQAYEFADAKEEQRNERRANAALNQIGSSH